MTQPQLERVLFTAQDIQRRVAEIGREISSDYADLDPVLLCVLKGAVVFLADLIREIQIPHTIDFIAASSYGNDRHSSGTVTITHEPGTDLRGRHVIIVEDIYDTGCTLDSIMACARRRGAGSVEAAAFLVKRCPRVHEVNVRYTGFEIDPAFVVGYGLDHAERFRDMPCIGVVGDHA